MRRLFRTTYLQYFVDDTGPVFDHFYKIISIEASNPQCRSYISTTDSEVIDVQPTILYLASECGQYC